MLLYKPLQGRKWHLLNFDHLQQPKAELLRMDFYIKSQSILCQPQTRQMCASEWKEKLFGIKGWPGRQSQDTYILNYLEVK